MDDTQTNREDKEEISINFVVFILFTWHLFIVKHRPIRRITERVVNLRPYHNHVKHLRPLRHFGANSSVLNDEFNNVDSNHVDSIDVDYVSEFLRLLLEKCGTDVSLITLL